MALLSQIYLINCLNIGYRQQGRDSDPNVKKFNFDLTRLEKFLAKNITLIIKRLIKFTVTKILQILLCLI